MDKNLLEIDSLSVSIGDKIILQNLNLGVKKGEIHVIMGRNGKGKSTLFSAIVGNPQYKVAKGRVIFEGDDITFAKADVRARKGIFLSFQTPVEIPGITLADFIRSAVNAKTGESRNIFSFRKELREKMKILHMDESYADRALNVGFSGGEKKKSEILQLLMLNPKLALLDETDSGLDVDAVKNVSEGINLFRNKENSIIIITHNEKLLEKLPVDFVHILDDGKVVQTGGKELASEIVANGYAATEVR